MEELCTGAREAPNAKAALDMFCAAILQELGLAMTTPPMTGGTQRDDGSINDDTQATFYCVAGPCSVFWWAEFLNLWPKF